MVFQTCQPMANKSTIKQNKVNIWLPVIGDKHISDFRLSHLCTDNRIPLLDADIKHGIVGLFIGDNPLFL